MFGGVDALLRESQDNWWLRDQSQLALGFDNWGMSAEDLAYLNRSPVAVVPASSSVAAASASASGLGTFTNGATAGAIEGLNGNNGNGGGARANGGRVGGAMDGGYGAMNVYNEEEWYQ